MCDSNKIIIEHVKNKHGERWRCVDAHARNYFKSATKSMITCAGGVSMHEEWSQMIDGNSKNYFCLVRKGA